MCLYFLTEYMIAIFRERRFVTLPGRIILHEPLRQELCDLLMENGSFRWSLALEFKGLYVFHPRKLQVTQMLGLISVSTPQYHIALDLSLYWNFDLKNAW